MDAFNDRLSILLTLLLTIVAFKFVISGSLPKVNYSTKMDSFLFDHIAFLFVSSIACAFAYLDLRLQWLCGLEWKYESAANSTSSTAAAEDCNNTAGSAVNVATFGVCLTILVAINLRWLLGRPGNQYIHDQVQAVDKKNWYSFAFANPGFLPPLVDLSTEIEERASSRAGPAQKRTARQRAGKAV